MANRPGSQKAERFERDEADIDELVEKDGRLDVNELETIPTMVPREGDGYQLPRSGSIGQRPGRIGEPGYALTEDDLRRINTRKGLIQLLENKAVDIEEVRKTLLYEQELRQLQVELVKLPAVGSGQRRADRDPGRRTRCGREGRHDPPVHGASESSCHAGRRAAQTVG